MRSDAANVNSSASVKRITWSNSAASDLIECGWDIAEWSKQSSTVSHPFDRFRLDYGPRLADLKRALKSAEAASV